MPDSKITALTSISTSTDPANDPLVIVDVSDTSMAATGTTKKVTLNNLLACSPTATLASATISGDLTVDTSTLKVDSANDRVGIQSTILNSRLTVRAGTLAGIDIYRDDANANFSGIRFKGTTNSTVNAQIGWSGTQLRVEGTDEFLCATNSSDRFRISTTGVFTFENVGGVAGTAMTLNSTGLGVGVSPSAWVSTSKAIDIAAWAGVGYIASSAATVITNNTYKDAASNWVFKNGTNAAGYFEIAQNLYRWWQAPAAGGAGTTAAMVQAMTLDTSGNLIVNGATQFAKISSYVTNSGTFQSALGATNGANSDFVVRIKTSVSDVYNSVGSITLSTGGSGGTERVRVKDSGQVRFVPLAADPAGAEAGDVYYNSVSNRLKYYNGTAWTLI